MLVLSRKKGEQILIGNDIKLIVLDISGQKVRLGIDAPCDVVILRKEVLAAIQRNVDKGNDNDRVHKEL